MQSHKYLVQYTVIVELQPPLSCIPTQEFFIDFSSGDPCVLSRSALQILYSPLSGAVKAATAGVNPGQQQQQQQSSGAPSSLAQAAPGAAQFAELLKDAVRGFIAPPALLLKTPPFAAKQVDNPVAFRSISLKLLI